MSERIQVDGQYITSINFAMQQNFVPVIRELVVHNVSEEEIADIEVRIRFEPEFAREFACRIERIGAGKSVSVSPVRLQMRTEFLFSLTEKMTGEIRVEVRAGEETLYGQAYPVELLACDQWCGLRHMPEIVAAFVTPNHPAIAGVIRDAAQILREWTGSPSFTGYQTRNPDTVKKQMAALYTALRMRGLIYVNPPAGYETSGQRVRMPNTVLEQKQGTCLDLAVLYAACLEAVGLHPLLVFETGHAFAACWLEEATFPDCMVDDCSAIQKRMAAGAEEILPVECTDLVAGGDTDFDRALKHGLAHFADAESFECAIDVRRCRGSGIRPIPLCVDVPAAGMPQADGSGEPEPVDTHMPSELEAPLLGRVAEGSDRPLTKERVWERKLLDLSLRNSLLNFRVTKNALQLMVSDMAELEDVLSDGKDLHILEIPAEWTFTLRDAKMYEIENERDLVRAIAADEFKNHRVRTFLNEKDLDETLKNLYRSAKVSMEENGSNTLFLALGFLRWYESDVAEKPRYAPVVLIPVDIVRSARNRGYVIRSRQEEAQINITLLEYLRQDMGLEINGLDPLPADEHGIDLGLVLHTVRQAILEKKRWNIEDKVFLGLFSFSQFVMWNDLRSRMDELKRNKVVSSLIEGRMMWQPKESGLTTEQIESMSLSDMAVPVSADSSQMEAIAAAANGESFVLHGPPGTGKSQTITNMIANALYHGKSVLFVAQKMAALSVVQKRLANIGLDPFCLELHSNKTNKTAVLGQLERALEVGRIKSPEEYRSEAVRIGQMREKLAGVLTALHEKRSSGVTLYEAITRFERTQSEKGKVALSRDDLGALNAGDMEIRTELVRQMALTAKRIGRHGSHPLREVGLCDYSMDLREDFVRTGCALRDRAFELENDARALLAWIGLALPESEEAVTAAAELVHAMANEGTVIVPLAEAADYETARDELDTLIRTGEMYIRLRAEIAALFDESVFTYAASDARVRWKQADASWFLAKNMGQNRIVKELKGCAKNGGAVTRENAPAWLDRLCALKELGQHITDVPGRVSTWLGGIYAGERTNWKLLRACVDKTAAVREACGRIPGCDTARTAVACVVREPGAELIASAERIRAFCEDWAGFCAKYAVGFCGVPENGWLLSLAELLARLTAGADKLRDITACNAAMRALRENGLTPLADAYRSGTVDAENMTAAYECCMYRELALLYIAQDVRLTDFSSSVCDDLIGRFSDALDEYSRLTAQELAARLSAAVPSAGTAGAATSEMGILKRAIKSNGRMLSVRRLFDQIPNLLRRLCPCMLMSPISVAQYIDPSFPKFDLVVFDEASQLPTSEAVGTIARGEEVIIVGDPKQLPPTNFFAANRVDEENAELEDLESLLDDCLAISMPQRYLKWHYRSRHESLIAFSNMQYYDNRLYTFPSPNDLVSKVRLVQLEGTYDKGRSKQNRAEAQAIVGEIIRRLSDEQLRNDSIGVVTFSSVQQNLIDDLLSEEWAKHPELEDFDRASNEPVFIKNLENVQGDERDVILFSVGYGPDEKGRVSMNFGPLNRDGGWRRLNVAISRARKEMVIYSVLRPEQIDLGRTRSEGVAGLKGFLEFAARGQTYVAQRSDIAAAQPDRLAEEIGSAIERELGYAVRCNIGCSYFRLDIGVIDPEHPEEYILGILLDGPGADTGSNVRDRFVLQPGVLRGLGWRLLRVWALDWLDDPQRVLEAVRDALECNAEETQSAEEKPNAQIYRAEDFERDAEESQPNTRAKVYRTAQIGLLGTADDYYLPETLPAIRRTVQRILRVEAPISREDLMHKTLAAWGITRGGARVERIFEGVLAASGVKAIPEDGGRMFLWLPEQDPAAWTGYRTADPEGNKRAMDDVPRAELREAITEVLEEQISLTRDDLVRETAKKFGFTRLGGVIMTNVNDAIDVMLSSGDVRTDENGRILPANR